MDENIQRAKVELRVEIEKGAATAPRVLTQFAQHYAITRELLHAALATALHFSRATQDSDKARLRQEMLSLTDKIVADHEAHAEEEAGQKLRETARKIDEHFQAISPPRDLIFVCERLGKTYRKGNFSLKDVNLTLRLGEITGVVGANANGKTTLFRLVAGELKHDRGTLAYPLLHSNSGGGIDWVKVKEHIAYVPQDLPRWYGSLEENLRYEAALHGIRGSDNDREVAYIIERLRLSEHLGKRWDELSGGFKLRFALAKALVCKPKLMLIDEPLANLDFKAQLVVLRDLRDLASGLRHPMSVMISSQHLHEVEAVADNILFLKTGEVVYNGPISGLGEARQCNTYELNCPLDLKDLHDRLKGIAETIYFNGLSYVVTTPVGIGYRAFLGRLIDEGVEIEYFRDISRSIKQLFAQDDTVQ